jgi:hypothetical protein
VCLTTVRVHVVDDTGAPVFPLDITVCGNLCTYGGTDANGDAVVTVQQYVAQAAVGLHGRATYTSYYQRFDGQGAVDVGTLRLHRWTGDASPIPSAASADATAKAGPLEVDFTKGANVEIDLTLTKPEEKLLRAQSIPLDEAPPFARAVPKLASLVAIAPFGTSVDPGASVALANDAKLAPGASVDLYAQTTGFSDGPWAGFVRVASGHVTPDGTLVRSDPGAGIPELSWIGVVPVAQ